MFIPTASVPAEREISPEAGRAEKGPFLRSFRRMKRGTAVSTDRTAANLEETDPEWLLLIWAARRSGLTIEEVRKALAAKEGPPDSKQLKL